MKPLLISVQGAQHGIVSCTNCESYPGKFGDTVVTCFNYVAGWLSKKGRLLRIYE